MLQLFAWGSSSHGQCGLITADQSTPVRIHVGGQRRQCPHGAIEFDVNADRIGVVQVAVCESAVAAVDADGRVWQWGGESQGGEALKQQQSNPCEPQMIEALAHMHCVQLVAGAAHFCALTADRGKGTAPMDDVPTNRRTSDFTPKSDETSLNNTLPVKWRKSTVDESTPAGETFRAQKCDKCRQSEQFRLSTLMNSAVVC